MLQYLETRKFSTIPNREPSKPRVSIPREKIRLHLCGTVTVSASVHPCAPSVPFELLACRPNPSCNNFRHRQHVGKPASRDVTSLQPGQQWVNAIDQALQSSIGFLFFASSRSLNSVTRLQLSSLYLLRKAEDSSPAH